MVVTVRGAHPGMFTHPRETCLCAHNRLGAGAWRLDLHFPLGLWSKSMACFSRLSGMDAVLIFRHSEGHL